MGDMADFVNDLMCDSLIDDENGTEYDWFDNVMFDEDTQSYLGPKAARTEAYAFSAQVIHYTEKAILVRRSDATGNEWIPRKMTVDTSGVYLTDETLEDYRNDPNKHRFKVTMWLAKQKGWVK